MMKMPEDHNPVSAVLTPHYESHRVQPVRNVEFNLPPMDMALLELEEAAGESLDSTLEEMSLVLSGRMRDDKRLASSEKQLRRQQELIALIQRLREQDGGLPTFLAASTEENSEALEGLRRIFTIAQHLASTALDEKRKKALNAQLAQLIEENACETSLFGLMELGTVSKAVLAPIGRLFQRAMDEQDVSLSEWFKRIVDWSDRQRRLRVVLRMAAFELSLSVSGAQQTRLATVLVRLRRLLLFLGLEQECKEQEKRYLLPADSLLTLLIDISQESWLFEDWLIARISALTSSTTVFKHIVRYLDVQFRMMPDACFGDEDQRESILAVLQKLKGNQVLS